MDLVEFEGVHFEKIYINPEYVTMVSCSGDGSGSLTYVHVLAEPTKYAIKGKAMDVIRKLELSGYNPYE